jgi:hypothetical protein
VGRGLGPWAGPTRPEIQTGRAGPKFKHYGPFRAWARPGRAARMYTYSCGSRNRLPTTPCKLAAPHASPHGRHPTRWSTLGTIYMEGQSPAQSWVSGSSRMPSSSLTSTCSERQKPSIANSHELLWPRPPPCHDVDANPSET